jgi:hypothetical protein
MLPIGPLMEEHRVIEKLMPALRRAAEAGRRDGRIDLRFADLALDFIRTYADRCHHGKEEDVLFRALAGKPLAPVHRAILDELVEEHGQGRRKVREIAAAVEALRRGHRAGGGASGRGVTQERMGEEAGEPRETAGRELAVVVDGFEWLAAFYPAHIRKEDREFFLPVMAYFDPAEKSALIAEGRELDRALVRTLYRERVEALAAMVPPGRGAAAGWAGSASL